MDIRISERLGTNVIPFPGKAPLADNAVLCRTVAYAQPVIELRTGHINALEFLARRIDPDSGDVLFPSDFFSQLSQRDTAGLDLAMSECVCNFHERGTANGPLLHINMSADVLRDTILFNWMLLRLDLSPGLFDRLVIEVLESSEIDETALSRLNVLKRRGARLALDDFGVGYSNYGRLLDCEFDRLKLDRSLVSQLPENKRAQDIVGSIIALARRFGLTVVAEGVEKPAQAAWLQAEGCPLAQGFLWGYPVPTQEFESGPATVDVPVSVAMDSGGAK